MIGNRGWREVRRVDDHELCGHVCRRDDGWEALSVFGGFLALHPTRRAAEDDVLSRGLASLALHWWYRSAYGEEWHRVCIQEASPDRVRVALGHYSLPGVPTVVVTAAELEQGRKHLRLEVQPD